MRIDRGIRHLHADRAGTASFEFMLIFPVMLFIFFLGHNWTLHLRERVEIRTALRTSTWSLMSLGDTTLGAQIACKPVFNGLPLPDLKRGRVIRCDNKIAEERPSTKTFWADMKTAVGNGQFETKLIKHVEPEKLTLTAARGHMLRSPAAKLIGVTVNPLRSDGYGLTNRHEWTHDEKTFEGGHDDVIYKELKRHNTHKLFPDIYRKAK